MDVLSLVRWERLFLRIKYTTICNLLKRFLIGVKMSLDQETQAPVSIKLCSNAMKTNYALCHISKSVPDILRVVIIQHSTYKIALFSPRRNWDKSNGISPVQFTKMLRGMKFLQYMRKDRDKELVPLYFEKGRLKGDCFLQQFSKGQQIKQIQMLIA